MKIVITGGAGFIGYNLALYLKHKYPQYDITAFDNLSRKGVDSNVASLRHSGVGFIKGDIRSPKDFELLNGFDCMIEASAEPSVLSGLKDDPAFIIENNLIGAINCFRACFKNKAQVIFLSTSRVYPLQYLSETKYKECESRFELEGGQSQGISTLGMSEQIPLDGARSFYGTTKLAAEQLLLEYGMFCGLNTAITRFSVVAGPGQMGKTDQGIAAYWMAQHIWKGTLDYIGFGGMGKQVRDILHINDLLSLIDMQIHKPELFNNQVFNAGGGLHNTLSLREMTDLCAEISGNKIVIGSIKENRPGDIPIYFSDNSLITKKTGWQPKYNTRQIFTDIFNWLKENEQKLKPIFTNIL